MYVVVCAFLLSSISFSSLVACSFSSCVIVSLVVILIPLSGPLYMSASSVYVFSIVVLWCVSAFCVLNM